MANVTSIAFPSGISVKRPLDRLSKFLAAGFDWYDSFIDESPHSIVPFDVLVATGINAFIGGASAATLRTIHLDMVKLCTSPLNVLAVDTDLAEVVDLAAVVDLIVAATEARGAQSAVATKILHRKRRHLVPILDSVVVGYYCEDRMARTLAESYAPLAARRSALTSVLATIRADLRAVTGELAQLRDEVAGAGWPVGTLRIHDILVWTELEARGYYR
jgi:hypothetical protein